MDARKRQKLLQIIDLANKHPAYAKTIGVRATAQQELKHSSYERKRR